jgi:hypothetical protein
MKPAKGKAPKPAKEKRKLFPAAREKLWDAMKTRLAAMLGKAPAPTARKNRRESCGDGSQSELPELLGLLPVQSSWTGELPRGSSRLQFNIMDGSLAWNAHGVRPSVGIVEAGQVNR